MKLSRTLLLLLVSVAFFTACETTPPKANDVWLNAAPRSILVIPPANASVEVNAPYTFLSTISKPLAEKGYYVFPVAVIDRLFKENGVYTTEEMNRIPLDKIRENTGADAVMYVTINNWGQKFVLLSSYAIVDANMRIVDARNGALLWESSIHATQSSDNQSGGGLLGAVLGAVADQIAGSLSDATPQLARQANNRVINNGDIPDGPYRIAAQEALKAQQK